MPFQRSFPRFPKQPGTYFIRGPRQIGKTTWLKSILSQEAKKQKSCFYLSCENVFDFKELATVLAQVKTTEVVILDEISFVRDWWRAVKHELDKGSFNILILSGSHTRDVRKGMDQMPGRWGEGQELLLLPMTFSEFSSMRKQANWPALKKLDELKLYFKIGGFPIALHESGPDGNVPEKARQIVQRWLVGDILKLGKQELYLKEIMLEIAKTQTSTLSLQRLAQNTNLGSHHTAIDYVQILEDCFALKSLYFLDPWKGKYQFKKEKKFYFRDPIFYWIAWQMTEMSPPENFEEKIAEMTAHEHLSRKHERIGYYKSEKGEIDFVSPKPWAIEVKWAEVAKHVSRAFTELNMLEKTLWTQKNFLDDHSSD